MSSKDYRQIEWDADVEDDCRQLVRLAVREDLDREQDWTTLALVEPDRQGAASITPRQAGVICGIQAGLAAIEEMEAGITLRAIAEDGDAAVPGRPVAVMEGAVRDLLTCERIVLNLIGRLSGVATLTRQYVEAASEGGQARVYDTRKTTPGWRRLEKLAVKAGGGCNHRLGLYDGILIKDNHLASRPWTPHEAVARARALQRELLESKTRAEPLMIEIEVDTLDQLDNVLPAQPDIVLLDNMTCGQLREAVERRDALAEEVELEASGGVNLDTIGAIAATGVDRISVGALTHSAVALDVGLDWND